MRGRYYFFFKKADLIHRNITIVAVDIFILYYTLQITFNRNLIKKNILCCSFVKNTQIKYGINMSNIEIR